MTNKTRKPDPTRKPLALSRETLRTLTTAELTLAVGGVEGALAFRSMICQR